ncbi:MAG: hypothetical protein WHS38_03930 [Thermodesulforhabdaceae bacterium]
MRCSKCGYISFDYLDNCKKCGASLSAIRSELCPFEAPPKDFFVWEWLGLGVGADQIAETIASPRVSQQIEMAVPLEISLEDQTEEIIIDDEAILEIESEGPVEAELPSSKEQEGLSGEISLELEIPLEKQELVLEETKESLEVENLEMVALKEEPGITEKRPEMIEVGESLDAVQPLEDKQPEIEVSAREEKEKEEEVDEILLDELDKILEEEK